SGTVWNDLNNSANGTFTSIYTSGETPYSGATPYFVYLADGTGTILDSAAVITSGTDKGTYILKNVTGSSSGLSLYLSTTSLAIGSAVSGLSLAAPTSYILTSPATRSGLSTSSSDQSALDFGVQLFSVSGTIYNDVNGTKNSLIDGTVIPSSVSSTQLYVNLVNATNTTVLASAAVSATGTYVISSGLVSGTSYNLVLTTAAVTIGAALPAGWVNTAEGNTGTGDATANGLYNFTMTSSALSGVNFGIDATPTATSVAVTPSVTNPGGTSTITVPSSTFAGTDATDLSSTGSISAIHLTAMPANVTSITVTASTTFGGTATLVTYGTGFTAFPTGTGLFIATATNGNTSTTFLADPANGAVTLSFSYTAVDAAGKESAGATSTIQMTDLAISGTVYDDVNGAQNNLVDGAVVASSLSGTPVYINLLDAAGTTLLASSAVGSDGTYSFGTASGVAQNTSYKLILTTGAASLTAGLPANWTNTAEGNATTGDGSVNGSTDISVTTSVCSAVNFGVDYVPTANDKTAIAVPNPNGSATANVVGTNFSGADGDISGGGISYIHITSFPTNADGITVAGATSFGGAVSTIAYTSLTFPAGGVYVPTTSSSTGEVSGTAVAIDPPNGAVTSVISFKTVDAAGKETATAKSVSVPFTNGSVLPLRLLSFNARQSSTAQALLTWTTASEVNTSSFVIEQRLESGVFETAGTVAASGQGTGDYRFTTAMLAPGLYSFRLKMVDRDGRFTYSDVKPVRIGAAVETLTLMPNPVQSGTVRVRWSNSSGKAAVRVVDGAGRVVYTVAVVGDSLEIRTRGWAAGTYQVVVGSAAGVQTAALVVQ
ncbi:MAG: conserved repeat domain protein, partial [Flaviaesturariibacter sp.]|nr:conserved repeat domain protein [Flaviaesturariibacter sp.]